MRLNQTQEKMLQSRDTVRARDMAEVVEHLPGKHKDLSAKTSTERERERKMQQIQDDMTHHTVL
jgi:hypothetical protein